MTTTLQSHGGGAQPASIDTSGRVTGGTALRVYGFDSVEAAHAAGYVCEGGPAMSVALITDAQLASGAWKAEGDPSATVVYTAPSNMPVEGGYAVPVYAVNGWGSTPAPSGPTPLLDLEADTLAALSNGDPVSLWADQSGNGYDFTQTGSARPIYRTGGGVPYVEFATAAGAWMDGVDFGNLDGMTATFFMRIAFIQYPNGAILQKAADYYNASTGWWVAPYSSGFSIEDNGGSDYLGKDINWPGIPLDGSLHTITYEVLGYAPNQISCYLDGVEIGTVVSNGGSAITTTNNSEHVTLGTNPGIPSGQATNQNVYAVLMYSPALSPTDRAAVEAGLATRYGIAP